MSIIITCAGSNVVNGVYDFNGNSFAKRNGSIFSPVIVYSAGRWTIGDINRNYYYLIESNDENSIIDNGVRTWVLQDGAAPLPKVSVLNHTNCTTVIISGSGESSVNGEYTLQIGSGGVAFYTKGNNLSIEYVNDNDGDGWVLYYDSGSEIIPLYTFYGSIVSEPPIGEWTATNQIPTIFPGSTNGEVSSSANCLVCGGGGAPGGVSIIILTDAGTAAVNGTYTSDNNGGSYFHSDGIHAIVPDPDTGQTWSIVNMVVSASAKYYSSTISVNEIPTSFTANFNDLGNGPAPIVTVGGGGASAPVMKILMKPVPVVVIANSTNYPQVNGIYYLVANPSNVYDSFFSKDGGDSYPRIIFNLQSFVNQYPPYFIKINSNDNEVYHGTGDYPQGWPEFADFGNASWYYTDGNNADITSSTSTVNKPHIYKIGNIAYVRT
jgi:hypothetical protein